VSVGVPSAGVRGTNLLGCPSSLAHARGADIHLYRLSRGQSVALAKVALLAEGLEVDQVGGAALAYRNDVIDVQDDTRWRATGNASRPVGCLVSVTGRALYPRARAPGFSGFTTLRCSTARRCRLAWRCPVGATPGDMCGA
jgi:hypothetical protein